MVTTPGFMAGFGVVNYLKKQPGTLISVPPGRGNVKEVHAA